MKFFITTLLVSSCLLRTANAQWVKTQEAPGTINVRQFSICVDKNDAPVVKTAARLFQEDLERVTGFRPELKNTIVPGNNSIIIGSLDQSALLQSVLGQRSIGTGLNIHIQPGLWEAGEVIQIPGNAGNGHQLIVAGSDPRGAAFALMELSRQMGVSPWYWWADVPVVKKELYIDPNYTWFDMSRVKYRGIFINDEAPALSGWSHEKFGGFNNTFYRHVFELMLRLKANYIWPAMWGNAFYDDDKKNKDAAIEYGIVIGTSHHEPMMRAHDEWRRYGKGKAWNYETTTKDLQEFWREGLKRANHEKIVTIGMRGDGDEPMTRETATQLLERIVADQRKIIEEVTEKPAAETPQIWALYKEVQDYYDKGMRVPDDVTLLLCDDNWGNIRRVPELQAPLRTGGYGIYYHFDYVGGPRNYKWINTNPLPRIWEQLHLAWEYQVRNIWIVNVGDIKPMEFPISFFLDYAWDPERVDIDDVKEYSRKWAAAQFGEKWSAEIADLLAKYAKYNSRRKPEMLDHKTYSLHLNEWVRVLAEHHGLLAKAKEIKDQLPQEYQDAYFQLVLHPVWAAANLVEMYFYVAQNHSAYEFKNAIGAQHAAEEAKKRFETDSLISLYYHQINNGKWNHMMSQTHIGYTYWQQPAYQVMPELKYLPPGERPIAQIDSALVKIADVPSDAKGPAFYQQTFIGVSIDAHHFTRKHDSKTIQWKVLADLGRTSSAVAPFPVTAGRQTAGKDGAYLEYDIYTYDKGEVTIHAYFSPTLNIHNTPDGLNYGISVNEEKPQVISINKEDKNTGAGIWEKWVGENIIIKSSKHVLKNAGRNTIKYWAVDPGVVLQKIVVDFGDTKETYLGPPETLHLNQYIK